QQLQQVHQHINDYLPHEVRTAVTGMLTASTFLHNELDSLHSSIVKDILGKFNLSAQRLSRLTENFLLHTRLELRKQNQSRSNSTLPGVQTSVEEVLRAQANKLAKCAGRADDLVIELTDAAVAIDQQSLDKIIQELVDNAIKFSP
ncbi:MAG: hypothetical protein CUN55_19010, partial [Phototrophicales bacterium]